MEDEDRPIELYGRVPNDEDADISEVTSLTHMWLDSKDYGTILLQFYPDTETSIRQLGYNTAFAQTAIVLNIQDTYNPNNSIPTRLFTPLSLLCSAYNKGGIVAFYKKNSVPKESNGKIDNKLFLIPNLILVICGPLSSGYLKQLSEWKQDITFTAISGQSAVIEAIIRGREVGGEYKYLNLHDSEAFVKFVREVRDNYYVFPLILIGPNYEAEQARSVLDDNRWELDQYGLYTLRE
jgi:hypothetical protein